MTKFYLNYFRGLLKEKYLLLKTKITLHNIRNQNPILVYQMGKVGSSTIVRTLNKSKFKHPVLQVHTLSSQHLNYAVNQVKRSIVSFLPEHLIISRYLIKEISKGIFPCRIITLSREPLARAISFIFEDIRKQVPEAINKDRTIDTQKVLKRLNSLFKETNGISDPSEWFNRELKECFGIDVFSTPFNWNKKFLIIRTPPIEILILRMEDINEVISPALAELLNADVNDFKIEKANIGKDKWYAPAMKEVKGKFSLPPQTLDWVLHTKYSEYFYPLELGEVRKRWEKTS